MKRFLRRTSFLITALVLVCLTPISYSQNDQKEKPEISAEESQILYSLIGTYLFRTKTIECRVKVEKLSSSMLRFTWLTDIPKLARDGIEVPRVFDFSTAIHVPNKSVKISHEKEFTATREYIRHSTTGQEELTARAAGRHNIRLSLTDKGELKLNVKILDEEDLRTSSAMAYPFLDFGFWESEITMVRQSTVD